MYSGNINKNKLWGVDVNMLWYIKFIVALVSSSNHLTHQTNILEVLGGGPQMWAVIQAEQSLCQNSKWKLQEVIWEQHLMVLSNFETDRKTLDHHRHWSCRPTVFPSLCLPQRIMNLLSHSLQYTVFAHLRSVASQLTGGSPAQQGGQTSSASCTSSHVLHVQN